MSLCVAMSTITLKHEVDQLECATHEGSEKFALEVQSFSERFLSRSLTDFLKFGQFLVKTKEKGGYRELAELHESSFFKTVVAFAQAFSTLCVTHQQRLLALKCPYWTISCLRKLPKIPSEQFENFLAQVEFQSQQVEILSAKQIETVARQFLVRRRNYLALGQLVTEEDWQLVAEKLHLSEEQLKAVQFETFQLAQVNWETGEAEFKTDEILEALELCGIAPDVLLSHPVRLKRRVTLTEAENLQLKQETQELKQEKDEKERHNLSLQQENTQLRQQLAESQKSSQGEKSEPIDFLQKSGIGSRGQNSFSNDSPS
ncbi:MAG: hypothetical protein ACRDEA_21250, partial [Microcystaceae cyanobacterium]